MKNLTTTFLNDGRTDKANVSVKGKLCAMDAMAFKSTMLNYIQKDPKSLALDLRGITEIDLTGVNCLTMIFNKARQLNQQLSFVSLTDSPLFPLLRNTKLDRVLPIIYSKN